jgi:hypothetical protein
MKLYNKLEYLKALCYGKHFSMATDNIQNTQNAHRNNVVTEYDVTSSSATLARVSTNTQFRQHKMKCCIILSVVLTAICFSVWTIIRLH